ncbi:hypothetical protein CERZMDRAFT_100726 [Cercospora zeae-maydis SCOH1-5]|uniref:Rhodopsin domain-containing protein n=1 Tax=Cercospora zeae-maydis SCOH1-5 TaxID=717836 RepID=A0A6A6F5T4_9PEZI|nr:hypothetical protein CERZMDRAFT_100726 [Cercospora zeae-maydis SCOH1-5]
MGATAVDNQRVGNIIAVAISLSAVWISVSLQAWIRMLVTKNVGRDDAFLLGAALLFSGYCMAVMLMTTNGVALSAGKDITILPNAVISMVLSSFGFYMATMIVLKISVAIFFLRFLTRIWQRWIIIGIVILNAINGIFVLTSMLFSCGGPRQYMGIGTKGSCLPPTTNYALQLEGCIINGITNWVFVILPVILLVRLPMVPLLKICTGLVLILACCASTVSLVRIKYIGDVKPGPELFVTAVNLCICTTAECGLGITAASAATLRPLFRKLDDPELEPIASPSLLASKPRHMVASSFYSTYIDGYYGNAETESQHQPSRPEFISRFSEWSTTSVASAHPNSKVNKPKISASRSPSIRTPPPPTCREIPTPPVPALPALLPQSPFPSPKVFYAKNKKLTLKNDSRRAHPPPRPPPPDEERNNPAAAATPATAGASPPHPPPPPPPPRTQPFALAYRLSSSPPAASFHRTSEQNRDQVAVGLGWV